MWNEYNTVTGWKITFIDSVRLIDNSLSTFAGNITDGLDRGTCNDYETSPPAKKQIL